MLRTAHFHVGNGDMSLITMPSGRTLLIDINIRAAADDPGDPIPDVARQLKDRLTRGADGRFAVDAMLLTHPDQDHCRGLAKHFHLGPPRLPSAFSADDRIAIRELWSSPAVFRRASLTNLLCEDAKAWAREARRRVAVFRATGTMGDGDRIKILGEDRDGKTDDLGSILVRPGQLIETVAGEREHGFSARLLAPLPVTADEDEEDVLTKNNSSVIMQIALGAGALTPDRAARYLFGGDAEVGIWEKLDERYASTPEWLRYHVLVAPHHCSWRSLSHDSWSRSSAPAVSQAARRALSRVEPGALVLASSVSIEADRPDPPCVGAEAEYRSIVAMATPPGQFRCLGDEPGSGPFEIEVENGVPRPIRRRKVAGAFAPLVPRRPIAHG